MRQQGFTIVELMIVITIMGIVAALAIPSFGNTIKNHQMRSTADNYYAAIRYARAEAVRTGRSISIEPINNNWSTGLEIQDSNGTVLRRVSSKGKLTIAEDNNLSSIDFNPKGFLASEVQLNFCDGRLAERSRRITVLVSGFAAVTSQVGC